MTTSIRAAETSGDGWSVFVVRDGRAMRQRVEVGHRSGAVVEIRDGLAEGARVILFPFDQIAGGVRVRMR
jgi:HlyD family secretion protein